MWSLVRGFYVAAAACLLLLVACGGRAELGLEGLDGSPSPSAGGAGAAAGGRVGMGGDPAPVGPGGSPGVGGRVGMAGSVGMAGGVGMAGAGPMPGMGGAPGIGGLPGVGGAAQGGRGGSPAAGGMPSVEFGTLDGRVLAADTDAPLGNVSVAFLAPNGALLGYAYTASDGTYSFDLPSGRVYAYFQLEGYLPALAEFEVVAGDSSEVTVTRLVPVEEAIPGDLTGQVRDAETGEPVENARVRVRSGVNTTQGMVVAQTATDANGFYVLPELNAGNYTVEGNASGYANAYVNAAVMGDASSTAPDLLLSRTLEGGQIRIVLAWSRFPEDLDAHLHVPPIDVRGFEDGFEVYYGDSGNLDNPPYAELDVDDIDSYGPETITISRTVAGTYHYLVVRFSEDADFSDSEAQVSVYGESGLVHSAFIPTTGSGDYWHVFDIDGESLVITPVNERLSSDPF